MLSLGCTKNLEIEIIESRCKDFRIYNATSTLQNPNCPGDINSNEFTVSFDFGGDGECLNSIHRTARYFDENNNEVFPVSEDPDSVHVDESSVTVSGTTVTYTYFFQMASNATYDDVQYVTLDFYTQNSNLNQSNYLNVLQVMPCKSIPTPTTTSGDITVNNTEIEVSLFDNAAEDGDIITIMLNGIVVAQNVEIFNTPKVFSFSLDPTISNYITFYAVNEGSSSPNTVQGTVDDGFQTYSFNEGLRQGETVSFQLIYQASSF